MKGSTKFWLAVSIYAFMFLSFNIYNNFDYLVEIITKHKGFFMAISGCFYLLLTTYIAVSDDVIPKGTNWENAKWWMWILWFLPVWTVIITVFDKEFWKKINSELDKHLTD